MHATAADVISSSTAVDPSRRDASGNTTGIRRREGAQVIHSQDGGAAVALRREHQVLSMTIPKSIVSNATVVLGGSLSFAGVLGSGSGLESQVPAALLSVGFGATVTGGLMKVRDALQEVAHFHAGSSTTLPGRDWYLGSVRVSRAHVTNAVLTAGAGMTVGGLLASGHGMVSYVPLALLTSGSDFVVLGALLKAHDGVGHASHIANYEQVPGSAEWTIGRFSISKNTLNTASTAFGALMSATGLFMSGKLGLTNFVPTALQIGGTSFMILGFGNKVRATIVAAARVQHNPQLLAASTQRQPADAA